MSTMKSVAYVRNRFLLRRKYLLAQARPALARQVRKAVGRHVRRYGQHEPAMSEFLSWSVQVAHRDLASDT